ncbi:hydroxylysine kinase-like [Petromyzon marinus]|uniref:hydroxylysine kinase-like n=1 Tax=Petromyzon marinus TaxID=7757 RepID=UPI003F7186B5
MRIFDKFEHPFLHSLQLDNFIWNLSNTHLLEPYLFTLDGDPNQGLVREVIPKFREEIQPNLHKFTRCIIHGDFNDDNILVQEVAAGSEQQQQQGPKSAEGAPRHRVSGIVDLNSMMFGYHVYDLAMAIMYMMVESGEAMEAGGHVLAATRACRPSPRTRGGPFTSWWRAGSASRWSWPATRSCDTRRTPTTC